jgi:general stress protein 26
MKQGTFWAIANSIFHIGTIDSKGDPNIHPTWYYFGVNKNEFYIETSKSSKKIENIKRNNLVYYCVDDPNPPYKGVRGHPHPT